MKLKLESQGEATVLVVSEAVETSHIPVLKAGLSKLFQSGKTNVLLDFTAVTEQDFKSPLLFREIADLRGWAETAGAHLIVVSPIQKLGHAPTRAEAVQLLVSPLAQLQAKESHLQNLLKQLEQEKAALVQKLGGSNGDEIKKLQSENTRLKKSLARSEKLSRKFLKVRQGDPMQVPAMKLNLENVGKLVDSLLQADGAAK